jgi:cytochrome P450
VRSFSSSHFQSSGNRTAKSRHHSTELWSVEEETRLGKASRKSSTRSSKSGETESEEFENWRLTLNEALNNTLLMFFAGYETTSSAITYCFKVLSSMPEQRQKLNDEIKQYWDELSVNMEKYVESVGGLSKQRGSDELDDDPDGIGAGISSSENDSEDADLDDDVFEEDEEEESINRQKRAKTSGGEKWTELYETLDKMKYLDMFVREVLRMFPIGLSLQNF